MEENKQNLCEGKEIYEKVFEGNKCNIESIFTGIKLSYRKFDLKSDADESKVQDDLDKMINYIFDGQNQDSSEANTENNIKDDLIRIKTSKTYYQGKFDIAVSNVSLLSFYSTLISILTLFFTLMFSGIKVNNVGCVLTILVIYFVLLLIVATMINSIFTKNAIIYNYCIKYLTYLEEKLKYELSK